MAKQIKLFVPQARVGSLYPALVRALGQPGLVHLARPLPLLRLDDLRCLVLRLHGSGEHVRAPMVFPLLQNKLFNSVQGLGKLHHALNIDWLLLGGQPEELATRLAEALEALGPGTTALLIPYAGLEGPLSQTPAEGEADLIATKNPLNFNQRTWAATCRQLLTLPEERWDEVGISNTTDLFHVFEPALARLLPAPPRLILDLGCGLGQITRTLALRYPGARVVGLDSSPEAIAVAREKFRLPNLVFAVVDFSRPLPFQPDSVDLITATNALPYALDQLSCARELFSFLTPGGLLLNHCRAEESHLLWDFPKSALLPTNTQLFLADWFRAAGEARRHTELSSVPLGMSHHYYLASAFEPFEAAMRAFAEPRRQGAPAAYSPLYSHVLLAHSALAQPANTPANTPGLPLAENHLERLDQVLPALGDCPKDARLAALSAWVYVAKSLALYPEALDFLQACLPRSAPVIRALLAPAMTAAD